MNVTPNLSLARATDIPRLVEIRAAVRENRLTGLMIGPDDYRSYIEDTRCWVAEAGGAVQAFAALDAGATSIWALFVDSSRERGGLGHALLERLIAEARAEAFCRRAGFTELARDGAGLRMGLALPSGRV